VKTGRLIEEAEDGHMYLYGCKFDEITVRAHGANALSPNPRRQSHGLLPREKIARMVTAGGKMGLMVVH
jgi:hypothetical protein